MILLTGEILKQPLKKAIVKLTHLFNAVIRLRPVPSAWKVAEVIMLPKPGKPPNEAKSYRPISLLSIISKLMEKLLLRRMKPIIESRNVIPNHQLGLRCNHSTIDQDHRITGIIEKELENKRNLLYTSDIPQSDLVSIATFGDDTALLATRQTIVEAVNKLQYASEESHQWTK